jgi:hypothetical protein
MVGQRDDAFPDESEFSLEEDGNNKNVDGLFIYLFIYLFFIFYFIFIFFN